MILFGSSPPKNICESNYSRQKDTKCDVQTGAEPTSGWKRCSSTVGQEQDWVSHMRPWLISVLSFNNKIMKMRIIATHWRENHFFWKKFVLTFVPLLMFFGWDHSSLYRRMWLNIHSALPFGVTFQCELFKTTTTTTTAARQHPALKGWLMPLYQLSPRRKNKYYMINK